MNVESEASSGIITDDNFARNKDWEAIFGPDLKRAKSGWTSA